MGTTTIFGTREMTAKEFVTQQVFTPGSDKCRLVDISVTGSVAYCAVQINSDPSVVFALVVKLSRDRGDWNYRDMDEGMGPHYWDCPARILDQLSPTDDQTSLDWRRKCREVLAAKKTKKTPKHGDIVHLESPIRFSDGAIEAVFTCEQMTWSGRRNKVYRRKGDGMLCRLRGLQRMNYTIERSA